MRGKILLLTGLAVGYVLGAKAGREKYNQLKESAERLWNDPRVKQRVDQVEGFVKDKAPEVADFVTDNAKKVAGQVGGKKSSGSSRPNGTGSTASTGSSTASGSSTGSSGPSSTAG